MKSSQKYLVFKTFPSRGFSIAVAKVWNSLLSSNRSSIFVHTFRRLLKTHCFQQAYSGSAECLRFGHRLTLSTLNTVCYYLLTYLSEVSFIMHQLSVPAPLVRIFLGRLLSPSPLRV